MRETAPRSEPAAEPSPAGRNAVMFYVLGAPGSGKTSVVHELKGMLPGWLILDWDQLMDPAETLTGRPVRQHRELWDPYGELVREVVDAASNLPTVLLTVCTPDELSDWPVGSWALLDCSDTERTSRLQRRGDSAEEIRDALHDAAKYRALGLPVVDSTSISSRQAARKLALLAAGP